jgi:protein-S-isoprenylcysteine O-methyltransferase Ste14
MTTRLVVTGLNRYVRNPIYLGAVTIFVGEALLLGRLSLLLYTRRRLGRYRRLSGPDR